MITTCGPSSVPPPPLKIGLLSLAHVHATTYIALLQARTDIELRVADPDDDTGQPRRRTVLATDSSVNFANTYNDLYAWGPDAVIICAETSRHCELVELSARHGVPVLCEKPLATTLDDARRMVDACKAAGVSLMTAYPVRFHPALQSIRTRLASGETGRIRSAVGTNNSKAPIEARGWFGNPDLAGGGALMDHIVHLADLMATLTAAAPVQVYAQGNRIIHHDRVKVETAGLVIITYADGTVFTIDCSWSTPHSYPSWGGLTLAIECEQATVEFDAFNGRIDLYNDSARAHRRINYDISLDTLMLDAFLNGIRSGTTPQPDGDAGLRGLQLVLAAYKSTKTGQPVQL
jgi:1,5-anhydro-D-fructose reductase (1,5-anhydro-D-mannitol-forming)